MKGKHGWIGLTLYVVLWDYFARQTLTGAFREGLEDPKNRRLLIVFWAYLTAHLFGWIPGKYDPLHYTARWDRYKGGV